MLQKNILLTLSISLFVLISACSDSMTGTEDEMVSEIDIQTIENLHAPFDRDNPDASPFIYFSLESGEVVESSEADTKNWDIAFRGTSILVNSGSSGPGKAGAIMLDVEFNNVEIAPTVGYSVDSEDEPAISGSGGWYTYTGNGNPAHAVIAQDDVTIILKTAGGNHYAKMHIMSYYEDSPDTSTDDFANFQTRPESQYYTFKYALQQTEGLRELK